MTVLFERDLHQQLERLTLESQRRVLEYARSLEVSHSGATLVTLAGSLSRSEADELQHSIDREFGQVDLNDW